MRRTKDWWDALYPRERKALWSIERARNYGPIEACPYCHNDLALGREGDICDICARRCQRIIAKADAAMGETHAQD